MPVGKAFMLPGCFASYRNIIFGWPSCTSIFPKTRPIEFLLKWQHLIRLLSNLPWITKLYILDGLGMQSLPLTPHPRLLLVLTSPSIKARSKRQIGQLQLPGWCSWNGNLGTPAQHPSWSLLLNVLWMGFTLYLLAMRLSPSSPLWPTWEPRLQPPSNWEPHYVLGCWITRLPNAMVIVTQMVPSKEPRSSFRTRPCIS